MFLLKAVYRIALFFWGIHFFLACSGSFEGSKGLDVEYTDIGIGAIDSTRITVELPREIRALKQFQKNSSVRYSSNIAFLVDMKIPSNHYRFFVVDLQKDVVLAKGLVAHGSGSETTKSDSLQFSNTPNSYMTSLGTYKIGNAYTGSFGRSYKLHGLDPTNSKAFERAVVLHRYSCVPDEEQPDFICNSLGCPMVSEAFFQQLDTYIKGEALPVLLEVYY